MNADPTAAAPVYPGPIHWDRIDPGRAGFEPRRLAEAVAFAQAHESDWPASLFLPDGRFVGNAYAEDQPPHDKPIGIVRPRGACAGVIVRGGRIAAEWGDIDRADVTFSVAKSYLGLLCGLAVDQRLIASIDEPVHASMPATDTGFASAHNRVITWRHLLEQTSEWEGTLWGIPDSVDRDRRFGSAFEARVRQPRQARARPGTRWEYNDVRVNRLALALLQVFGEPLPGVLRRCLMDPIGASGAWDWHGYGNSRVEIGGRTLASVSGGSHWGGGLFISTSDQARIGLLVQREGKWNSRQLLSRAWIAAMARPSAAHPQYGLLWWLNGQRGLYPSAPEGSLFALGGGAHLVWVDREHDLVMVARWIAADACDGLMARVLDSLA